MESSSRDERGEAIGNDDGVRLIFRVQLQLQNSCKVSFFLFSVKLCAHKGK